jgi:hypothetical protein
MGPATALGSSNLGHRVGRMSLKTAPTNAYGSQTKSNWRGTMLRGYILLNLLILAVGQ